MDIPFVDIKSQYDSIKAEIGEAITHVLERAEFIGGKSVTEFEEAFAEYCGVSHVVGVGNGTDGLHIALRALGIGAGDEVLVPVNTFIATAEAVTASGARAVFVDNDPDSYTIDTTMLESFITERTKAIIPVHLYGQPADMTAIMAFAERYRIRVIEDCAQAHGATYNGKRVGSLGDVAVFSFYPGKNLGAYGDGGAIATKDESIARTCRMLANHGRVEKYKHELEGFNSRLDALQAAVLSVKLKYLNQWNMLRQAHANSYSARLRGLPSVRTPIVRPGSAHVFHLYVIRVEQRELVQQALKVRGIASGIHYPIPLHKQPAYGYLNYADGSFPVAEQYMHRILSLPMYPELSERNIDDIVDVVTNCYARQTSGYPLRRVASHTHD